MNHSNLPTILSNEMRHMPALAIPEAASIVNEIGCRIMAARIARMGEGASGAYNYYARRVARGQVVADYEIQVLRYIDGLSNFRSYHEIGSGIGIVPMLLGLSGRRAVALEFDVRRQAAACEVYEALCLERPELAARCELVAGRFPDAVIARKLDQSLAIVTNLVATTSEELLQAMLEGFKRYAAVLFDVDRFLVKRDTDEQRNTILSRFEKAGLPAPKPVLNLDDNGRYYLIDNRS